MKYFLDARISVVPEPLIDRNLTGKQPFKACRRFLRNPPDIGGNVPHGRRPGRWRWAAFFERPWRETIPIFTS